MTTRFSPAVAALFLLITRVSCYSVKPVDRRSLVQNVAFLVGAATPLQANAVIGTFTGCAQGVGEGCADLAEGNDFIKSLQEKSAANREANTREALNSFYQRNYPDYFDSINKTMVKKPDGTFAVFSREELEQLRKENKLGVEIPKTKGGKYQDLTQKRILVLKE